MRPKKNGNDFAPQNMHPTKSIYNVSKSFINIAPTAPTHCCCCSLFFGGIHCFKKMYQKTRGKNFALTCFDGNYRAWWRALFHCSNPVRKNVVVWLCTLAIARVCFQQGPCCLASPYQPAWPRCKTPIQTSNHTKAAVDSSTESGNKWCGAFLNGGNRSHLPPCALSHTMCINSSPLHAPKGISSRQKHGG